MTQIFSSVIFVNYVPHVYIVDWNLEPSDLYSKYVNLEHFFGWF